MAEEVSKVEEMLDVVDPATGLVTEQRTRRQVHELGLWHQVFHCLVVRPSAGTVVLQQRSHLKSAFPGLLDLSATGHLEAGERPVDGVRELEEELGFSARSDELIALGHRLLADDQGEGFNREMVHLFLLADDRPVSRYRPASHEVSALVEIGSDALLAVLADGKLSVDVAEFSRETGENRRTVDQSDLVDGAGNYWVVAAVMADRFLRGEQPLAV